jgi:hypothetical protein
VRIWKEVTAQEKEAREAERRSRFEAFRDRVIALYEDKEIPRCKLSGTEKQVTWAREIRLRLLSAIAADTTPGLKHYKALTRYWLSRGVTRASDIIDLRHTTDGEALYWLHANAGIWLDCLIEEDKYKDLLTATQQ